MSLAKTGLQGPAVLEAITERRHPQRRLILAIAGPPASGKSTYADRLAADLGETASVVPMDGFHLDNAVLERRGLLARMGAPETFDTAGLAHLLTQLKTDNQQVIAPLFDRARDAAIAGAKVIEPHHQIILVEGNYLLLDQSPWAEMAPLWDMTVALSVPLETLEKRLIARWQHYGLSEKAARERALSNDIPNAKLVVEGSRAAEVCIESVCAA